MKLVSVNLEGILQLEKGVEGKENRTERPQKRMKRH